MSTQVQNSGKTDIEATHFQKRGDVGLAFSRAISTRLFIPKTRGFWPISLINENDDLRDMSGNGQTATNTGAVTLGLFGITPIAQFSGSNHFSITSAAVNKITGALTVICFFRLNALGAEQGLISKWGAAGNRSYRLLISSLNAILFQVSSNGTLTTTATSTLTPVVDTWYFALGEYNPSTSLTLVVNGTTDINTTSIPASIFDSTAALLLGSTNGSLLDGDLALPSLHASVFNSAHRMIARDYARPLFGITL